MLDGRPPGQPRLVVHNTFLELDDKQDSRGGRPRAQTDITERKAPRKVSYHVDDGQQMIEESPSGFPKLGSLSEDFPAGLSGDPNQVVQELSMGLGGHAGSSMVAAAAAAAQLGHPLLPSVPSPGYYPGLPPGPWPPWGHPAQGFPPNPALPPPHLASMAPGVWPYPLPYPALDPAVAAMAAQAATGPAPNVMQGGRGAQPTSGKGRGRGRGANANGKAWSASESPTQSPVPAAIPETKEAQPKLPPEPPVNGTTIMLRNLPTRFSQETMLQLLNDNGFQAKYDFVYLPMDFRNGTNLGYAFVNTLTHQDALAAMEVFQGYAGWGQEGDKSCEVSWAHPHQGLQEHVERYRNSPVMHPLTPEEYKPMVFANGQRVPFPAPTKAIRAPKLKTERNAGGAAADA
mmetsp:Transcript_124424/g.175564  ORF Transcript_124424/g.175564 Transcript_124424/m.175564 type:complete len:402 (-) Transcript_124424:123-1328(-)